MEIPGTPRHFWQARFTTIITLMVVAFLLFVAAIGKYILSSTEQQIRENTGAALSAVLSTVNDAILIWENERENALRNFLSDAIVVSFAKEQVKLKRNPDTLRNSDNLLELREYYRQIQEVIQAKGFFIITPDRISVASARDSNIGTRNLIHFHRPDLLNRAFQGEIVFIPPIKSDIAIDEGDRTMSIFLAGPIRDESGKIIAVGTLRIQPRDDFNRITKLGSFGETGESYAFDRQGYMLTQSRLQNQLEQTKQTVSDEYRMRVEDPGYNLLSETRPTPSTDLPLTHMAAAATQGISGINLEGYRDYLGVPVLGAWLWNEQLGMGLTTEINEAEALAPYYALRTPLVIGLFATGFVSLALLAIVITITRRNNTLLTKARDDLEVMVTERTRELVFAKEKAEEASRAKSNFLANVSHELRTPLTAIHGSIRLINNDAIENPEQQRGMMQLAEKNTERLIKLVNDLLDVEKIQAGKLQFHFENLPIMPQLEQAVATNSGYAEQYNVTLTVKERTDDTSVVIDSSRFQQVMANLLSNAIKFSPPGGNVEVRALTDKEAVLIEVKDQGPGIPVEFQDHAFDPFTQADTSSTREKGGTGLGLNISRNLIQSMQGNINFETQPGKGTIFRVSLPIANH